MTISKPTQQVRVIPGKASRKPVPLEDRNDGAVREWPSQRVALV